MSYYDIDAILTDAQKLPCTFELEVPGLGYLDGNEGGPVRQYWCPASDYTDKTQIKAGAKVDLPLWLGVMLAVSSGTQFGGQPLVTLDFPAPLQQRVVNALKADPKTVDLRAQAPQYYSLGAKILDLFEDEELADVLIEVCICN